MAGCAGGLPKNAGKPFESISGSKCDISDLKAPEYQKCENVKHINEDGIKFWYGRELDLRWENFSKAIDRAMLACQNSGFPLDDHFREITKMVGLDSGSQRSIKHYILSR